MNYTTRITLAALVSALLHGAGFAMLYHRYEPRPIPPEARPEPIVLNLQPDPVPPPEPPRQLVEVTMPSIEAPLPTDRIAETHAEAMDQVARRTDNAAPELELDRFDEIPQSPSPLVPPVPPVAPAPEPIAEPVTEEPRKTEDTVPKEPREARDTRRLLEPMDVSQEDVPDPARVEPREATKREEPIKIAQATPAPSELPRPGRSRDQNGVANEGPTNFSAIQSEIAPYLKHVRRKVERRWNEMLYTRYSGTTPVKAVIDCAINADGELVSVTVAGTDNDRLYSALCRDAVMRAGPFGPFTFEVPDIYRGKNLEIRWTFNFL